MASSTLSIGCSYIGYEYAGEVDASDEVPDAGPDGDVSDVGPADGASDGSAASDASFDAEADGAALDASDGARDAAEDGAGQDAAREGGPQDAGDGDVRDAAPDGAADAGPDASTDAAPPTPRCDLTGTYALKLTVPATWPSGSQISSGSGTFEFKLRLRATHVGDQVAIEVRECGQKVPPIHASLANEDHLLTYPNSLYDSEKLPTASATITLGDSTPSSSLSLPPVGMQMGVSLSDPVNDAWPATPSALPAASRVDVEGDGNPSVTAIYATSGGYQYPRTSTSLLSPQRAQQVYIAVRWVFSMTGALSSCDRSAGDVVVAKIDSRILGCRHADGSLCSTSESNHLDTNLPKFRFGAASYALSRVASDITCAAVRAVP